MGGAEGGAALTTSSDVGGTEGTPISVPSVEVGGVAPTTSSEVSVAEGTPVSVPSVEVGGAESTPNSVSSVNVGGAEGTPASVSSVKVGGAEGVVGPYLSRISEERWSFRKFTLIFHSSSCICSFLYYVQSLCQHSVANTVHVESFAVD